MTLLLGQLRTPRLRTKDANCTLSWFEGDDLPVGKTGTLGDGSPTYGNYPNRGSLGDLPSLRLGTGFAVSRVLFPGHCGGVVPWLQYASPYSYPDGLSTEAATTLGEATSITLETWAYRAADVSAGSLILSKNYYPDSWSGPYASVYFGVNSGGYLSLLVANGGTYIDGGAAPIGGWVPLRTWCHIGAVFDPTAGMHYYLNGLRVHSVATTFTIGWGSHGRWAVGGRGGRGARGDGNALNYGEAWQGALQGARVHNTVRSDAWFKETYQIGVGDL